MKSKLISIPYTVGLIKPHIALREDKVSTTHFLHQLFYVQLDEIYKKLDQHNFEVFHQKRKILSKEEILNLFYSYRNRDFYQEIEEHMMTADSIVLLLINKVDSVWSEEK